MDDLAGLADDIAGAVEGAMDAIEGLQALAGLGDLRFSGDFKPLQDATDNVGTVGKKLERLENHWEIYSDESGCTIHFRDPGQFALRHPRVLHLGGPGRFASGQPRAL